MGVWARRGGLGSGRTEGVVSPEVFWCARLVTTPLTDVGTVPFIAVVAEEGMMTWPEVGMVVRSGVVLMTAGRTPALEVPLTTMHGAKFWLLEVAVVVAVAWRSSASCPCCAREMGAFTSWKAWFISKFCSPGPASLVPPLAPLTAPCC